jgi:hypothetical protein
VAYFTFPTCPSNATLVLSRLHPARLSVYRAISVKSPRWSALRAATSAYSDGALKCTRSCPRVPTNRN